MIMHKYTICNFADAWRRPAHVRKTVFCSHESNSDAQ